MTISTPSQHQSYKNNLINSPDYLQGICDQQRVHNLQRVIPFRIEYTHLGLTIPEAVLLSQMLYWSRIHKDRCGWFFKTQEQWTLETSITRSTFYNMRDKLVKLELIDYELAGDPLRMHFRVDEQRLNYKLVGVTDEQRMHNFKRAIPFRIEYTHLGLTIPEAVLLSQMLYWSRIHKDRCGWFFKTQEQWTLETSITRSTFYNMRDKLVKLELIDYELAGDPLRMHFRVDEQRLNYKLKESQGSCFETKALSQNFNEPKEKRIVKIKVHFQAKIIKEARAKARLNIPKKKTNAAKKNLQKSIVHKSVKRKEGGYQKLVRPPTKFWYSLIDNKITTKDYNKKDYLNADVDNFFAKSSQQSQQESDLKTKEKEKRDEVPPDKASINMQDITNPDKDGWLGRAFDEENNMPRSLYEELLVYLIDIGKEYDYNSVNRILKKIVVTANSKGRSLIFENKQKLLSYLRKVFKYEKTQPSECNNNLDWRPKELHRYWVSTGLILSQ